MRPGVLRRVRVQPRLPASVLSPKYEVFCCDQNGPPARRSEPDWRMEGAYLERYVTDEQLRRRPIFIATLWAGASWLFFRVARSPRMTKIWALRSRLEKQPTDLRQNTSYFGDRTLVSCLRKIQYDLPCQGMSLKILHGNQAPRPALDWDRRRSPGSDGASASLAKRSQFHGSLRRLSQYSC